MDIVHIADPPHHLGRDDRRERGRVFRQRSLADVRRDDIVQQQHAHLVAGDGVVLPVRTAHHDADTVGVRIGAEDEVAADLLGEVDGQIEALRVFRVRALDGRERAVEHHLLLDGDDLRHAQPVQRLGHKVPACAVKRRVDDLEAVGHAADDVRVDRLTQDVCEEGLVRLRAHELHQSLTHRIVKVHALDVVEDVQPLHVLGNCGGVLRRQLRTVGPVDLVAVIFLRVVAGRDVQSGRRAVVLDGERQLRRRAQGVKNTHMDAVGRHDGRGLVRKALTVDAAVKADGDAARARTRALGLDDLRERLRGVTDDVDIHAAAAERHLTAQAGRAELERGEKAALDLFFIIADGIELFPLRIGERGTVEPTLVFFHVITHRLLLPSAPRRSPPGVPAHRQAAFPGPEFPLRNRTYPT